MMQANDDETFVYTGARGERIPDEVKRVRIDKRCKIILDSAFSGCVQLEAVFLHDGVEEIRYGAFYGCKSLRRINFPVNLSVIGMLAFAFCKDLVNVEFPQGVPLIIGEEAFRLCTSLSKIKLPDNLQVLGKQAFLGCTGLKSLEIPSGKRIGVGYRSFGSCTSLQCITIPLNIDLLSTNHKIFDGCDRLNSIYITGEVHRVVSSLTLDKWKADNNAELKRINSILPSIKRGPKTTRMVEWMETLNFKIERYKLEHNRVLKEAMALLELALWKAKLEEDGFTTKKRKRRAISRVNCGAAAVIGNVCSYLTIFEKSK